ncbi:MAG: DUF4919 domain-containing protein [Nocardioidaceae bacterium]|nr:DUF4919 domain-containing protein [Nocardioidaceae bacterium]MCL2615160.1 DUF4919 domain-containing protein [Nocardioidaceae bacterium]
MTDDVFGGLIEAYLREPTDEHRRAVRDALASRGNYDPELAVDRLAAPYVHNEAYADLVLRLLDLMPGAMLSPLTHRLLGDAYEHLGDMDAARRQRTLADLAVGAVLASGDGTAERPWAVLRVSDEHDAAEEVGRSSQHVRYEEADGRLLDVHECDDGSLVWFDVSLLQVPVTA